MKFEEEFDTDFEEETEKVKSKLYSITVLSVIFSVIAIIGFLYYQIISSFDVMEKQFQRKEYYVLEIDHTNTKDVMNFLDQESEKYCESMYKVEYIYSFPHSREIRIYCKEEDDIQFSSKNDQLLKYIQEKGIFKRK